MPFCPECGKSVNKEDEFCIACGRNLIRKTSSEPTAMTATSIPQTPLGSSSDIRIPKARGLLILQIVFAIIGGLFLIFGTFGGYEYRYVWGDIYLYQYDYITEYFHFASNQGYLLLLPVFGFLLAIFPAVVSLLKREPSSSFLKRNTRISILGGSVATFLTLVGAFAYLNIVDADYVWLESGFYVALVCGLLTVFLGLWILKRLKS